MTTCRTPEEVAAIVIELCANSDRWIVGIDGIDGVGKSTLAKVLGRLLGATVLSLDNHLTEDQGSYIPYLRYDEIAQLAQTNHQVIVEGICLRAALGRLGLDQNAFCRNSSLGSYTSQRMQAFLKAMSPSRQFYTLP
jgi:hypothetical protein